jgi:ribosomal protein S8E
MIRRIISLISIAAVISSCSNSGKKVATSQSDQSGKAEKVEFASLVANPDNYVGKNIIVEGKVVHVCTESGKKLFIVGENPDIRLYVAAGENMPKFPMDLLGSEVSVEGVITRVGGPAMAMVEGESHSGGMDAQKTPGAGGNKMSADSCETETALAGQPSLANFIMEYRSHTVK